MPLSLSASGKLAVAAVAVTGALLAPGTANAVVTLGPPMSSYDSDAPCNASTCATVHQLLPSLYEDQPAFNVTSPAKGVIVRYRFSGTGTFGGLFTGRYVDDAKDVFVRTSATPEVKDWNFTGPEPPWISVNPGKPIEQGEYIGLLLRDGARLMQNNVPGAIADFWKPALPIGVPTQAGTDGPGGGALNRATRNAFQAQVELDKDGDGLGDESQDPTPPVGPPPPSTAPGADTTKPTIGDVKVIRGRLITVRTTISEAGVVRLEIAYRKAGRKRSGDIKEYRRTRSSAGPVKFTLPPAYGKGAYRVRLTAWDFSENRAVSPQKTFKID